MDKISYAFGQIEAVFDIAGFWLGTDGTVLKGSRNANEYLSRLLADLQRRFYNETKDQHIPGIYSVEKNVYFWCFALEEGNTCIFGPAGGEFLTSIQMDAFRHHYHLGAKNFLIPRFPILKLIRLMCLSCYMMTGAKLDEDDVRKANAGNMQVVEADIVDYQLYRYNEDKTRQSYEAERKWISYIEEGNVEALNENTISQKELMRMYDGIGVMADNDFKQMEYMVVSSVTLATRAAIRGGVPPFVCYEISDLFLQKTSKCKSVLELLEIAAKAPERFVMLVHEHQIQNRYGAIIEQCKDYIARNLYKKFTITDMASVLAMNRTYLSQMFSQQTGVTLQAYIRRERLKAAANLLKYSSETVGQIAEYMQFSSPGRFCGYFKEVYQMTPLEYRNKYKVIDFM